MVDWIGSSDRCRFCMPRVFHRAYNRTVIVYFFEYTNVYRGKSKSSFFSTKMALAWPFALDHEEPNTVLPGPSDSSYLRFHYNRHARAEPVFIAVPMVQDFFGICPAPVAIARIEIHQPQPLDLRP